MRHRPVAIVTGGGTGIGAATAVGLRADGWDVVICGRRHEPLQQIAEASGAVPLVADVSSPEDVDTLVHTAQERFGSLNGLVLNAGVVRAGSVGELADEDWDEMVRTNLSGPFRLLRAAMPHLLASRGAIVGVCSAAALRASGGIPGYNATKAGLAMLIQSVAVDYGPRGVRANAVCPGWVKTEMADIEMRAHAKTLGLNDQEAYEIATSFVPVRRAADAAEVARAIAWLLSEQASYINAAVVPVDGGMIASDPGSLSLDSRITFAPRGSERL